MANPDWELVAVCSFLDELSLDEIIEYGPAGGGLDDDEMTGGSSVTGATSDEASDSEDLQAPRTKKRPAKKPKTEFQRQLQQVYDRKSRENRQARLNAMGEALVPMLDEFVRLAQFRLVRTQRELHVLCLAKKNGAFVPTLDTALRQVELNRGAIACIQATAEDWNERKNGVSGKCFLKPQAADIQELVDTLGALEAQLSVVTSELRWRLEATTTGVWV
ncbi:hypothetical protein PHYPSEUDO_011481 [Phytophthora pseudosyringae]|uniref:Uncharacterized protein n=1 Tax=Phytophthora pseudosyringae TaxID=221518 RepID=A0A8T1V942_9STRA|nr:hypothetical protein PHYPSEUDO_011481 [Phytophthora pseudosyringae]